MHKNKKVVDIYAKSGMITKDDVETKGFFRERTDGRLIWMNGLSVDGSETDREILDIMIGDGGADRRCGE